jgi:dsDNA-binding SOS-regulon protein
MKASMRARFDLWGIAAALIAASCSPHLPVKVGPDLVIAAGLAAQYHKLIDEGCYLCLRDVVRQYQTLDAAMKEAPAVQDAATEGALLFVMRDKELSIPVDDDWRAAQALVDARAAESADYAFFDTIADAFPWNAIGVGEDFIDARIGGLRYPPQAVQDEWRSRLGAMWQGSELAAYVYVSLNCEFRPQTPIDMTLVKNRYAAIPLIQYRSAACGASSEPALKAIIQRDARFYEARYLLALHQAGAEQYDDAQQNDLEAWQGVPRFTEAGLSYANLALTAEQFDEANHVFDGVLAVVPTHRRALLGRIESLTYTGQYQAAADEARRMIALGHWMLGDAYYWLALNEYHLEQITQSLQDVTTAKNYEAGARVHFLGGLIRIKQQAWTDAKQEFLDTIAADADYCDAMLDLGQMNAELRTWQEGSAAFASASTCYARTRQSLEIQIATLSAQPGPRAARLVVRRRADLRDTIDKQGAALYAAAVSFSNLGSRERALTYAAEAQAYEAYADRAKALIALLQRRGAAAVEYRHR